MRGLAVFSGARIPHAFNCIADPYYDSPSATVLLLHGEGANGGTTFTDSSPYAHSVTVRTGSPTTSTAQVKIGTASLSIASNQALQTTLSWEAISDNWTWEGWHYRTTTGSNGFFSFRNDTFCIAWIDPGNGGNYELGVLLNSLLLFKGTTTIPLNTWTHLAVSVAFSAGTYTLRIFVNGVLENTTTSASTSCALVGGPAFFGAYPTSTFFGVKTYLDEVRLTSQCLYTATFTPPTTAFTALGSNACTSVLLHAEDTTDSSVSPKTVTRTGSAVVSTAQKKFGDSSFYVPNPGSSSLNGVTVATGVADFSFGISDFTIEMWAYRESNASTGTLFYMLIGAGFSLTVNTSGAVTLNYASSGGNQSGINPSTTFPLSTWCFVVVQRRGTNFEFYFDGVLKATTAITGGATSTVNLSGTFYIGRTDVSSTAAWGGYIDEVRVTRGVARYTADFVPDALPNCNSTHGAP